MNDAPTLETAENPVPRPAQATVLVVDDYAEYRELAAHLLRQAGYQVLEANCGQQAQRLAEEHGKIDLLATDLTMPGMNGVDLARWFHKRFPFSKVLLVSGSAWWEIEAYVEKNVLGCFPRQDERLYPSCRDGEKAAGGDGAHDRKRESKARTGQRAKDLWPDCGLNF